tara:strand:- start:220 stop:597 length:378 start_codon:yes stop_codon:yes gene_type:complete
MSYTENDKKKAYVAMLHDGVDCHFRNGEIWVDCYTSHEIANTSTTSVNVGDLTISHYLNRRFELAKNYQTSMQRLLKAIDEFTAKIDEQGLVVNERDDNHLKQLLSLYRNEYVDRNKQIVEVYND